MRKWGLYRNVRVVADFKEFVKDCKLKDVGCRRHPFTWSKGRFRPRYIEERLDRFMCNHEWREASIESTTRIYGVHMMSTKIL